MMVEKLTLFLDDVRDPPSSLEGEVLIARTFDEACDLWYKYADSITHLSLDHDLGTHESGYDFLLVVIQTFVYKQALDDEHHKNNLPVLTVHSMNPVGKKNMEQAWVWLLKRTQEGSNYETLNNKQHKD